MGISGAQSSFVGVCGTGRSASKTNEINQSATATATKIITIKRYVFMKVFFLRLDCNVATDFGLAGQDVILRLVFFGEGLLHGHSYIARYDLDAARSARSRATCVVDKDTSFVGGIEYRRTYRHGCDGVRYL